MSEYRVAKKESGLPDRLFVQPRVLVFDEHDRPLEPLTVQKIDNEIISLKNTTNIFISHNWNRHFLDKFNQIIYFDKLTLN